MSTDSDYPPGSRKIDRALTDMQHHLDWLREHRSKEGDPYRQLDLHREVGVKEAMDILARYHAKVLP